jgi:hypothetical protein
MTQYGKPAPRKDDLNTAWSVPTVSAALARRKALDGATKRAVDLRLALDELEDRYGVSSAVAMVRIKAGSLQLPAWQNMYEEYLALIRKPGGSPWPV